MSVVFAAASVISNTAFMAEVKVYVFWNMSVEILRCIFLFTFLLQLRLASLQENKDQVIRTLQKTGQRQETEIHQLSHQILTKEKQVQQAHNQLAEHANLLKELENMKMKASELEKASQRARSAAELAQEEASYYRKRTTQLHTELGQPVKVSYVYVYMFSA